MAITTRMLKTAAAALLVAAAQAGMFYSGPALGQDPPADEETKQLELQQKRAQTEKAMWEAREAEAKARSSAVTSQFGTLSGVTNQGTVSAGTATATFEANLLAAGATRHAAQDFAERLCGIVADREGLRDPQRCRPGNDVRPNSTPRLPIRGYALTDDACESLTAPDELPLSMAASPDARREEAAPDTQAAIVMLTETQNYFDGFEALMVRLTGVGRQMCNALALVAEHNHQSDRLLAQGDKGAEPVPLGGSSLVGGTFLPTAATALNTVANLFRTEYAYSSPTLTADQLLLVKETAREFMLRRPGSDVFAPEIFPLTAPASDNPLQSKLAALDQILADVLKAAEDQALRRNRLAPLAEKATGARSTALSAAANIHEADQKSLEAAAKAYTDLLSALSQGAEGKPPAIAVGLRQARAAQLLKEGGLLVMLKINIYGGSSYSKKNFFTAFGGMPFYAAGGAVTSYAVMDGRSGRVLDALSVPVSSGFHSVPNVHRMYDRREARR